MFGFKRRLKDLQVAVGMIGGVVNFRTRVIHGYQQKHRKHYSATESKCNSTLQAFRRQMWHLFWIVYVNLCSVSEHKHARKELRKLISVFAHFLDGGSF